VPATKMRGLLKKAALAAKNNDADLAWSVLLGSLDAAEMHANLSMPADSLQIRTDRALALIESALAPQVRPRGTGFCQQWNQ